MLHYLLIVVARGNSLYPVQCVGIFCVLSWASLLTSNGPGIPITEAALNFCVCVLESCYHASSWDLLSVTKHSISYLEQSQVRKEFPT